MRWLVSFLFLALLFVGALVFWTWQAREDEKAYDPLIQRIAAEGTYPIDPLLVRAVIWRETNFNPQAYGLAQERGLMQVTPVAGQEWAKAFKIDNFRETDLFSPRTNIQAGAWYLSRALKRWQDTDNPVPFALAEYNAGRSNALRWVDPADPRSSAAFIARIDYPTTKRYVETIQQKYHEYQQDYIRPPWWSWWKKLRS
jgi:soluble lytic murein transglycosylase